MEIIPMCECNSHLKYHNVFSEYPWGTWICPTCKTEYMFIYLENNTYTMLKLGDGVMKKSEIMEKIEFVLFKVEPLVSTEEKERVSNLAAYGPLSVKEIDIQLAKKGWIEIYDTEPGNESVDLSKSGYKELYPSRWVR